MLITTPPFTETVTRVPLISMNKKISEIHQKRPVMIKGEKKEMQELENWVIEEFYVPYQAS